MRTVNLSEICEIIIGRTPSRNEPKYWDNGNKWVSISDLRSKEIYATKEEITDLAVEKTRCRKINKGTLLFSFKLTIGKMAFAGCDLFTNEAIAALPIKNHREVFAPYLFYALGIARLSGSNQAVMGKTLNSKSLAEIKIPLPSLDDQKRIAHLLGKVEGLIARRKQHLQQLDELLKSVFLEMFGDPVRNEKGWEYKACGDDFSVKHGFAFKSEYFVEQGKYDLLTPGNFYETGGFRDRGEKQKYYEGNFPTEYLLQKNDLLVAMTEQAPGLLGSPILVPESNRFLHNQRLGLICLKIEMNKKFLYYFFNNPSVRQIIHSKATGAKVRHTSPTKIEEITCGVPPVELQNQFAAIVEKVESLKSRYQSSLSNLEYLYGALSQKAFKGELDLERVPLAIEEDTEKSEEVPLLARL